MTSTWQGALTDEDFQLLDPLFQALDDSPFKIGDILGSRNFGQAELEKLAEHYDIKINRLHLFMRVAREVPPARRHKNVSFGVYEQLVKVKNIQQRWEIFDERANPADWRIDQMKTRVYGITQALRGPMLVDKGGLRAGGYKVDSEFRPGTEARPDRIRLMVHAEGDVKILDLGHDMLGVEISLARNTNPPT